MIPLASGPTPDPSASIPRPLAPPKPTPLPLAGSPAPNAGGPPPIGGPPTPTPLASAQTPNAGLPPAGGQAGAPSPIPLATGSGASPYATATTNTPGSSTDYLNKTITPGAGVDRLALAKSNFENFRTSTEPEYQAALREAGQSGAASGQVGSGMLRGRLGDIGLARTRDLQSAETSNLNNATEGSIGDAYNNIGIAQQQQGFQAGQQGTAFDQAQRQKSLDEALRNGDFSRYMQLLQAGDAGNPSGVATDLAGYYGNQAGAAGSSAADLLKSSYAANALKAATPPTR